MPVSKHRRQKKNNTKISKRRERITAKRNKAPSLKRAVAAMITEARKNMLPVSVDNKGNIFNPNGNTGRSDVMKTAMKELYDQ